MKQLVTVYGMRSNWVSLELRENRGGGGRGVGGHLARAGIQERRQCVDYRELG